MTQRGSSDTRSLLLLAVGATLLISGAVLLVSIGMTVLEVLSAPEEVKLVTLLMEHMSANTAGLHGNLGGNAFSIEVDEPFRTFVLLVLLVWVLGALASIIKIIVTTGKELVVAARSGGES